MPNVVIVGAGFAGLNCAKALANRPGVAVTLLDRENHHLFQPLLYQVATAALSPADISAPMRSVLRHARNVTVLMTEALQIDPAARRVDTGDGSFVGDYVLIAAGATHAYFGHEAWEPHAPGLKTLSQATEIRARILSAFEAAELCGECETQREWLTFAIVGGGPTGVEMAGAIAEMSRHTLARDFRRIDPRSARVVLIEAAPRLLGAFEPTLAERAQRDLAALGVEVRCGIPVTRVDSHSLALGNHTIAARTIVWAAGVRAAPLAASLGVTLDRAGRVPVGPDLAIPGYPNVFVAGDLAAAIDPATQRALPGVAQVAMQQGRHVAAQILAAQRGTARTPFRYRDLGQMATIGRRYAVCELFGWRFGGRFAWWLWLTVHIIGLTGFRNRATVLLQWAWSYFTFGRGARLIVSRRWRQYGGPPDSA
jgi:NADH dehydrogenase